MLLLIFAQDAGLSTGDFAGTGAASFVGASTADSVLSASGTSALSGVGNALRDSVFSASGIGALSGAGEALFDSVLTASGLSDFVATAESQDQLGSTISRGTFSRGQWREFRETKESEARKRASAQKRREEQERAAKAAARKAEKEARAAARLERAKELAKQSAAIEAQMFNLDASTIVQRFEQMHLARLEAIARHAMAQRVASKMEEDQEELEARALLEDS